MASSKEYLQFIIEQLSGLEDITYKATVVRLLRLLMLFSFFSFMHND